MSSPLENLPLETIHEILGFAGAESTLALRLTSKTLHACTYKTQNEAVSTAYSSLDMAQVVGMHVALQKSITTEQHRTLQQVICETCGKMREMVEFADREARLRDHFRTCLPCWQSDGRHFTARFKHRGVEKFCCYKCHQILSVEEHELNPSWEGAGDMELFKDVRGTMSVYARFKFCIACYKRNWKRVFEGSFPNQTREAWVQKHMGERVGSRQYWVKQADGSEIKGVVLGGLPGL